MPDTVTNWFGNITSHPAVIVDAASPDDIVAARKGWYIGLWKLNPIIWILLPFQRTLYNRTYYVPKGQTVPVQLLPTNSGWWYMRSVGLVFLASIALFFFAMWVFGRAEGNFAEEL